LVVIRDDVATLIAPESEPHQIQLSALTPGHSFFALALNPPSRQVKVAAARELAATAAGLINKLAMADPSSSSQPSDWVPLALTLMRVGVYQGFTGTLFDPKDITDNRSSVTRVGFINALIKLIPPQSESVSRLVPEWANPLTLDLVESVIGFGYTNLSPSALGAFLHKLGNATEETGIWGYFADGEALRALTVPVIDHLQLQTSHDSFQSYLERCVFMDPTDSPGSILAELVESIAYIASESGDSSQQTTLLAPERFVAWVSNHSLGRINSLAIWFALSKSWRELGLPVDASSLDGLWGRICVKVGDQLDADWESSKTQSDDQLVIVGSPKFAGVNRQTSGEKMWVQKFFETKKVDFSACWLKKGADLVSSSDAIAAFVITNSVTQGEQVSLIWPRILSDKVRIAFARPSIKWAGKLDTRSSTGVSVVVIGLGKNDQAKTRFYGKEGPQSVSSIGPYLVPNIEQTVIGRTNQISNLPRMAKGNMPFAESLLFDQTEFEAIKAADINATRFIKKLVGANEIAKSSHRYCIWIPTEAEWGQAKGISSIKKRVEQSQASRETSTNKKLALTPWRFREITETKTSTLVIPSVTSENRDYIPIGFVGPETIVSNLAFAVYDAPDWLFALLTSRTHMTWLRLVSGGLETRLRYSNKLSYNTFPAPILTRENKIRLKELGAEIIQSRGLYPEVSLGQIYSDLPIDLQQAHRRNDVYVGSIFGIADPENVELTISKLMGLYVERFETSAD
jgi:hypothetical protein